MSLSLVYHGDVDGDGSFEDPGDGTGLLTYLGGVEDAAKEKDLRNLAEPVRGMIAQIDTKSVAVIQATDLSTAADLAQEIPSIAASVRSDAIVEIQSKAKEEGIEADFFLSPVMPGESQEALTVTISMDKFRYKRQNIIRKGWTIEWINTEAPRHTVTADDGAFKSGTMKQGDIFTFTFTESGTFPYYCRFHGDKGGVDMAGTIIVQ